MVDESLVRYIKERLDEGLREQRIRQLLLQEGHDEHAVNEAFHHVRRHGPAGIIIVFLLVAIIVGVTIFFALKPDSTSTEPPMNMSTVVGPSQPSKSVVAVAEGLLQARQNQTSDQVYLASLQAATAKAATVDDGVLLCSVNQDIQYKNYCLQELAAKQREPAYCAIIGDAKQRDDCYLTIILHGEDQYCQKLVLEESKRVCQILLGEE